MIRTQARIALLGAVAGLLLVACGPPRLKTSNPEKLQRSLTTLEEGLEPSDYDRFQEALGYLVGGVSIEEIAANPENEPLVLGIYSQLDGMSANQIVAEAWQRRKTNLESTIADLTRRRDTTVAAREKLSQLEITASRVFKRNVGYLEWPVIEVNIENNSPHTVHLAQIRAALIRPRLEKPWLEERFEIVIREGLAPDKHGMWRFDPSAEDWIHVIDPHPDVVFTIEVMLLKALGGAVLAESDYGLVEEHRLKILTARLEEVASGRSLALEPAPEPIRRDRPAASTAGPE
jgi:hypothetical protein